MRQQRNSGQQKSHAAITTAVVFPYGPAAYGHRKRSACSPRLLHGFAVLAQGAQVAQVRRQRRERRRPRLVLPQQAPDAHVQRCGSKYAVSAHGNSRV